MGKINLLKKKKEALRMPMFDIPFLIGVLLLLAVGLIMLFSAGFADAFYKHGDSYYYIKKQLLCAVIGLVIMIGVSFVPYNFYRRFVYLFYIACVALLILVLIVSNDSEKRWLYIGGFQFQPSELAKVAVVLVLADYIARHRSSMNKFVDGIIFPGLIFGIVTVLIGVETHLSGAILVLAIGVIMIICGGCKLWHLCPFVMVFLSGAAFLVLTNDYMQRRIATWRDPSSDLLGDGWQITQSLITIGVRRTFRTWLRQKPTEISVYVRTSKRLCLFCRMRGTGVYRRAVRHSSFCFSDMARSTYSNACARHFQLVCSSRYYSASNIRAGYIQ